LAVVAGCARTTVVPPETTVPPAASPRPTDTPEPSPVPPTPTASREAAARPLLMAHYMPWYQAPPVSTVWGWHWTMEHFSPYEVDAEGRPEIASHYMPLTGPYDSRDEAILEYQVLLMKLSGIDGVIVDWYGVESFWDYGVINKNTKALFDMVEKAGLRFAVCYEDQTIGHMVNNDHLDVTEVYDQGQEVMRYLEETLFREDIYLTFEGRPVLFVFGPQYFTNASDWDKLMSGLDAPPALVTLDRHTESAGIGSFPWPPMWAAKSGILTQEALESYLTGFYAKAERWDYLVGGAFPGFHDIYEEAGVGSSYGYLDPQEGETYRMTLGMAVDQGPDVIQLITWNDYGEGTMIEPTEEFGYRYLEMTQEARRATDDAAFPFEAEDLRLPLQLLQARRQYADDDEVNARLDAAFDALIAGEPDEAQEIIVEYAEAPE
jgi:hypothetical protein